MRRKGFIFADALIGLAIVAVLATVLAVLAHRHAKASRLLAQTRAATRLCENVAAYLQAGKMVPLPTDGALVRVAPLPHPGPTPGTAWAEISTSVDGGRATLIACVPRTSLSSTTRPAQEAP